MTLENSRCVFFGTPELAVPFLKFLEEKNIHIVGVVTQPDKPHGRHRALQPTPVKVAARKSSLTVFTFDSLRKAESVTALSELKPDLFIVVAYGLIIPKKILGLPRLGSINVHPSLLPKYRGPTPIPAPILEGDTETGITIMKMDTGMDTGPILRSIKIALDKNETASSLTQKIMNRGPEFLFRVLNDYVAGSIKPIPQQASGASYTKMLSKADGLIDWHQSASVIERKIRAYQPWPVAFTYWNGRKLDILEAEHSPLVTSLYPGALTDQDGRAGIVTGGGQEGNVLVLKKVRLESKKEMSIESFLRGYPDFLKGSIGK
ncbi:MAG: methionyl-tRNA formyltransferase [Patescibacteria group bacterium]